MEETQKILSRLPKVDLFLSRPSVSALAETYSAGLAKEAVQSVLAEVRQAILAGMRADIPTDGELEKMVSEYLKERETFHLRRLINATGTVLHTNLGRSILSKAVSRHVAAVATTK